MEDKLTLSYKEISERVGIPLGTLYSLVAQAKIPHVRLGRRNVRFVVQEVDAWIDSHRVPVREEDFEGGSKQ
jgi:excisionase family DNA binding protein